MGRDEQCPHDRTHPQISIHSPRMGRDRVLFLPGKRRGRFQSTLPAWGETYAVGARVRYGGISIHSPRMGRDGILRFLRRRIQRFQSTLPAWGETRAAAPRRRRRNFNPLSPHGERRRTMQQNYETERFQSTLPAWGETFE